METFVAVAKYQDILLAPLAAGLLQPYRADSKLKTPKRTQLDRLYQKVIDDLDELVGAVGLKAA
jgi:hypothetical protein